MADDWSGLFDSLLPLEGEGDDMSNAAPVEASVDLPDEPTYQGESRDKLDEDWPHCEDCGVRIEWSGRGRRPKRCHEHRKSPTTRTSGAVRASRGKSSRDAYLESIESRLHSNAVKVGTVMGRYAPITGLVFIDRSDRFTSAAVRLAADKPQVLAVLEKIADTEPVLEIAEFIASVVFALGIDMGRVHPASFPAQLLGLTQLWEEYNKQPAMYEPEPVEENAGIHVPARAPQFGPGPLPTFTPIGEGV